MHRGLLYSDSVANLVQNTQIPRKTRKNILIADILCRLERKLLLLLADAQCLWIPTDTDGIQDLFDHLDRGQLFLKNLQNVLPMLRNDLIARSMLRRIILSFFVVISLITGGWMIGTSAMYE